VGFIEPSLDPSRGAAAARAFARHLPVAARRHPAGPRYRPPRPKYIFRILYKSGNTAALSAAVLAGLAVSVFPESALRPGMRVLGPADNFPPLPAFDIGLLRNTHESSALADALATHIIQGLDNLADAAAE
jgi:DNA-binding transcriptional LysR family regulator